MGRERRSPEVTGRYEFGQQRPSSHPCQDGPRVVAGERPRLRPPKLGGRRYGVARFPGQHRIGDAPVHFSSVVPICPSRRKVVLSRLECPHNVRMTRGGRDPDAEIRRAPPARRRVEAAVSHQGEISRRGDRGRHASRRRPSLGPLKVGSREHTGSAQEGIGVHRGGFLAGPLENRV